MRRAGLKGRLRRSAALVAALSLLVTACGARVSPYFPVSASGGGPGAAGAESGPGQVQPGASALGPSGSSTTVAGSAAANGQGTATGGLQPGSATTAPAGRTGGPQTPSGTAPSQTPGQVSVASLTPANFSYNPQAQASYCTGQAGNTASAPGVTPDTITVGNVSGLSGVVADSFTPGVEAVTSVFDAINRFGGICGRKLVVASDDDQQSSSNDAAAVQSLVPKVLAFVGNLSDADNGGVPAMVAAGTPDLGPAININRSNSPVYWSADGGSVTVRNGRAYIGDAWVEGIKQFGPVPKSMAVLGYSIPISAQAGQEYANLFQQEGIKVCYTNFSIPPAPGTVMGSVVSSMQQHNCDGVFTVMDVVGNADMLQDMNADGYHPSLISTTYESYTPDQISLAGQQAAQGLDVFLSSVPLSDSAPGVQLYQQELGTFEPGKATTEFGLEAWDDAELFVYALLKAGRNPTRASLTTALSQVTNWTSDGAFGPYTPSQRTGPPCVTNVVVKGNAFVKTWPSSGLYCHNKLVDVGPAGG